MGRHSAGVLLYRWRQSRPQVLLVHPGGPFWARRDAGAWSIPKGEYGPGEDPRSVACREFEEETGQRLAPEALHELGTVRQKGGKQVTAWAAEGDLEVSALVSNTVTMEWPRGSGIVREFPEVDRAEWFELDEARTRMVPAQAGLLDLLIAVIERGGGQ